MDERTMIDAFGRRWTVSIPQSRRERMRGLRDRRWLAPDQALLLGRCRSVHTFGMRFPVAVVFLDAEWTVRSVRRVPPGRLLLPRLRSRHVLECPADTDLRRGDAWRWEPLSPQGSPAAGTIRDATGRRRRART